MTESLKRVKVLTPEQIAALKSAGRQLNELIPLVTGLMNCGENCQEMMDRIEAASNKINMILQEFGGGRRN